VESEKGEDKVKKIDDYKSSIQVP